MSERHSDTDDELVEAISAYLDDELDAPARAELARRVETEAEAARVFAMLRSARDAAGAASADLLPTSAERARLDALVLATDATPAPASSPVVTPLRSRRQSPRKRGRPALPYFAAAALIAVVLSAGLALLVPRLSNRSENNAGIANIESATTTGPSLDASGSAGAAAESAPPAAAAPAADDGPALFIASVDAAGPADLAALLAAAPPVATDRASARSSLEATAGGVGDSAGLDALGSCLDAAPFTVSRVDTGTWRGTPAFFLSGGSAPGAASQVLVVRTPDCAVLATYP